MMKRSLSVLFIGVFLLLCLIPSVGMLIGGPSPLLANESAPRTPAFLDRDGHPNPSVLADTTDYIGTHFALRPLLVSARSFLYESLLHTSAEEQVTLGENGELYYSSTLDDYCGVGLSDDELRLIAARLAEIQAQVERDGGQFVFAVAPNKNSVIPERMPARFPADRAGAYYTRLLPLLREAGVRCVDLCALLSGQPELYYRTDSHWTAEGAALAADALLTALNRESSFAAGPFSESGTHIGDLYQMLYPVGKGREAELEYSPGFTYETASDPRGGNAITIRTSARDHPGSLYCRRDSFGIALYPYLAEAFGTAEFSRSADYSPEAFSGLDADAVILEIVERNLSLLLPDEEASS